MVNVLKLLWAFVEDCFRSPEQRAENAVLRHQLNLLRRRAPKRPCMTGRDRALFVRLYRQLPSIADATGLKTSVYVPKTLSAKVRGLKQNRTVVGVDGGARKPSVGICLE
jgi:hypothetical protein